MKTNNDLNVAYILFATELLLSAIYLPVSTLGTVPETYRFMSNIHSLNDHYVASASTLS
jgi:hypothetical protein